jgi:hypothetical protein
MAMVGCRMLHPAGYGYQVQLAEGVRKQAVIIEAQAVKEKRREIWVVISASYKIARG